ANPKTIIEFNYAKKEIRDQIIKYDQIKNTIQSISKSIKGYSKLSNKEMIEVAELIYENHKPIEYDYIRRFNLKIEEKEIDSSEEKTDVEEKVLDDSLFESLRSYRLNKAKEKGIPIYFIFNNEQLSNLVLNKPKNREE